MKYISDRHHSVTYHSYHYKTMITNDQLEYDNTINYKGTRHDKRLGCKPNLTSQSTVVSELIPKTYFMY